MAYALGSELSLSIIASELARLPENYEPGFICSGGTEAADGELGLLCIGGPMALRPIHPKLDFRTLRVALRG